MKIEYLWIVLFLFSTALIGAVTGYGSNVIYLPALSVLTWYALFRGKTSSLYLISLFSLLLGVVVVTVLYSETIALFYIVMILFYALRININIDSRAVFLLISTVLILELLNTNERGNISMFNINISIVSSAISILYLKLVYSEVNRFLIAFLTLLFMFFGYYENNYTMLWLPVIVASVYVFKDLSLFKAITNYVFTISTILVVLSLGFSEEIYNYIELSEFIPLKRAILVSEFYHGSIDRGIFEMAIGAENYANEFTDRIANTPQIYPLTVIGYFGVFFGPVYSFLFDKFMNYYLPPLVKYGVFLTLFFHEYSFNPIVLLSVMITVSMTGESKIIKLNHGRSQVA